MGHINIVQVVVPPSPREKSKCKNFIELQKIDKNKKWQVQEFQWREDINAVVISALSSTKPCLSF